MSRVYDKTLIDDMVRHLSLPTPLAKQSAQEILAIIHEGLMRDGVVNVTNLGSFRLKPIAARSGFNPHTRERITIPAHQRVVFAPAKALRDQAEPPRGPSVPIKPEESDAPAVAMTAPAAVPLEARDEPRPPVVDGSLDRSSIGALAPPADGELFRPEARTLPQPVIAPVVAQQSAESVATTIVELVLKTVVVPPSAREDSGDKAGPKMIPAINHEKAADSSTKRNYFLGAAAILLLASYITFEWSETTPYAFSAKETSMPATPVLAVASEGEGFVSPTADFYFKEQAFEIARGETLWRLAEKHYRDAYLWPHIFQANTTTIANPDYLVDGETIVVPGLEGPPDALSEKDRYNIAKGYYLAYLFYQKVGRSDAPLALQVARRYDASVVEIPR